MKISIFIILSAFIFSCATAPANVPTKPQEIIVKVEAVNPTAVTVTEDPDGDGINRSMEVSNPEGQLSQLSFTSGDKAFIKIFSGLSIADVTRFWNDIIVLENNTKIRDIDLFINSPGGDAFSGLALADEIERAAKKGFKITAHASGIIASAAVPVFAMCNVRLASPGTIFMVHEAALWKWPGQETASDIRSQNELMVMLADRYRRVLADHSKIDVQKWCSLEEKTTWFTAETAKEWGLVDRIE